MKKIFIISLILAAAASFEAFAQTTLKGTVADSKESVIGAMILNKDNGKWASSLEDGSFVLEGTKKGNTLEVTCLGYLTQTIVWDGTNPLKITLESDAVELDEAVAIGYGSVKKKDLTGSVGVLNGGVLAQQSATNVSQRLQGTIPGLTVTRSSGMAGARAKIRVRGITTLSDNSPLILVDGMAVSSIDNVSSDDIDQITVLKDGASASIYGARAAAGVILITTKQAREGEVSIGYNGEVSAVTATEWADYLTDPITYMTMFNEYKWNDAGNPIGGDYQTYPKEYIDNYWANNAKDPIEYPNYDWFNAIVKKASFRHKHNISMSYGGKVIQSRTSVSYENTDALYQGCNFERIMARTRNTFKITKKLRGELDMSFKHSIKSNTLTTPLKAANMYPSIYLGEYPDGRIAGGKSGSNTLAIVRQGGSDVSRNDYLTGRISLSWKPFEGFDLTGSMTPTFAFTKVKTMSKAIPYYDAYDTGLVLGYISGHTTNDLTEERNDANTLETQLIATYEHSFANKHHLNVMAGYEDYSYFHESLSAGSTSMDLADFPYLKLANSTTTTATGNAYENAYRSFFGRVMYNYKSKYYIQLNARGDGSSRFAKAYRWGFFPSASLGWVISEERWMQNAKAVNYLKLRGSIGTLGNERIGNYPYQASISNSHAIMYGADGATILSKLTAAQAAANIEDITWETTWTYDVGVDAAFFNNRLNFAADYYFKETKDMLLSTEIPDFTGYDNPEKNVGTMHTNGWEVKLDWKDKIGDFSYGVGFNLSDYKSVMGNMDGQIKYDGNYIITEGEEYYSWYGYKSRGLIRTPEDLAAAGSQLITTVTYGDIAYQDISGAEGEPDGKVTATYDKTVLGSSLPHFIYGGYINLGWKNWSLGVMFNGVGKKLSLVTEDMVRPFVSQWLAAPSVIAGNYFSQYNTDEQNASVFYPRLSYTSAEKNNYMMSDYWLFNGAYLRIKNINLAYTVPSKVLDRIKMKGLKVYFNVDDPFCFDNYLKGWDPERGASSYIARTFTLGLDIKF